MKPSEASFQVDNEEEASFRRQRRKRLGIVGVASVILIILLVLAVVDLVFVPKDISDSKKFPGALSADQSIKYVCSVTLYPDSCVWSMSSSLKNSSNQEYAPLDLFQISLQIALQELLRVASSSNSIAVNATKEGGDFTPGLEKALSGCEGLTENAINHVNSSLSSTNEGKKKVLLESQVSDIRTWLSAAMTAQAACSDGIKEMADVGSSVPPRMRMEMQNATEFTSNSLAIASKIMFLLQVPTLTQGRVSSLSENENPKPDLIVDKDGSGHFKTIAQAVKSIPPRSKSRFVIHVKEGVYVENVNVTSDCWNVMMYGDGMNKTIVSGSLNVVDGTPTFSTATFVVGGKRFIAKDMGFRNTAGPEKQQAVALLSYADESVFYRCSFDAYQDTLFAFSNRQFYKECVIRGTIDFIFGNAAVVFQNCSIQPRQPLLHQYNTITAQGKFDPNQPTGFSIQNTKIKPYDYNLTARTFLGRPWRNYSTTVFMQSDMGMVVDPMGWVPWESEDDPPSSIFYAEHHNFGPGSGLDGRVKWAGYKPDMSDEEVSEFQVDSFIQGDQWLPGTGVKYH